MGMEWNRDTRKVKDSIRLNKEWILSRNRRKEGIKKLNEIQRRDLHRGRLEVNQVSFKKHHRRELENTQRVKQVCIVYSD